MQHGARAGLCAELCAQCNIIKCTVQANLKRRELVAIMFAMHVFERMHSLYFHTHTTNLVINDSDGKLFLLNLNMKLGPLVMLGDDDVRIFICCFIASLMQ